MKFPGVIKLVGDTLVKHSPLVLTICATSGVVATAILTAHATAVSTKDYCKKEEDLTKKEIVKEYWKNYIPPAILGGVTIACVIGAHRIDSKRQLALASAYQLAETSLREYQDEVRELIGEKKEHQIHDNLAKKHVDNHPIEGSEGIIVTGSGNTLFFDNYTGRYFESDIEKIKRIENELNKRLNSEMFISLNELYYEIGLPSVPAGQDMGWNIDEEGLIDISYSAQIVVYKEKEVPCIVISYMVGPRFNSYGDFS